MAVFVAHAHYAEQNGYQHHEVAQYVPFGFQKRHGAFGNVFTDFLHAWVASVLLAYPFKLEERVQQADNTHGRYSVDQILHNSSWLMIQFLKRWAKIGVAPQGYAEAPGWSKSIFGQCPVWAGLLPEKVTNTTSF